MSIPGFDEHLDNYGDPGPGQHCDHPVDPDYACPWCEAEPPNEIDEATMESTQEPAIVITGKENIQMARYITVRSALKLEVNGLKRRGRSARQIANEIMGTNIPTKRRAYAAFNAWLVARGAEDKPLS
jgi:hypothetical protein